MTKYLIINFENDTRSYDEYFKLNKNTIAGFTEKYLEKLEFQNESLDNLRNELTEKDRQIIEWGALVPCEMNFSLKIVLTMIKVKSDILHKMIQHYSKLFTLRLFIIKKAKN